MTKKHLFRRLRNVLAILAAVTFSTVCTAEPIALYQLFRDNVDDFLTANCSERHSAQTNDRYGSIRTIGYVELVATAGTVPLYRLYNGTLHLYTTDPGERDKALRAGWRDEGTVGNVDAKPGDGKTALYRMVRKGTESHRYTISKAEFDLMTDKQTGTHNPEGPGGVIGYVWTAGKNCPGSDLIPGTNDQCYCAFRIGNSSNSKSYPMPHCTWTQCEAACKAANGMFHIDSQCQRGVP